MGISKSNRTNSHRARLPFAKRFLRALPIILLIALLPLILGNLGIVHRLEPLVFDAEMRLSRPPAESLVTIVSIRDDEYRRRDLFDSTSPLSRAILWKLIDCISRGKPAVIGVDIDTSAPQFRDEFTPKEDWPPIVWERELRRLPENASTNELEPEDVLGGNQNLNYSKNTLGLPLLIDDGDDGVTRRYRR